MKLVDLEVIIENHCPMIILIILLLSNENN